MKETDGVRAGEKEEMSAVGWRGWRAVWWLFIFFQLFICLCQFRDCCHSSTKSCPTLCNPMDYSPPDSSVHGISQARILEWVAISFFRGSSDPGIETQGSNPGLLRWQEDSLSLNHLGSPWISSRQSQSITLHLATIGWWDTTETAWWWDFWQDRDAKPPLPALDVVLRGHDDGALATTVQTPTCWGQQGSKVGSQWLLGTAELMTLGYLHLHSFCYAVLY